MNARQALIVRTFMNTQNLWSWPADRLKIIDEVQNNYSFLNNGELVEAYDALCEEGLFLRICYPLPVLSRKYFICSYDPSFLSEWPEQIQHIAFDNEIMTIEELPEYWVSMSREYTDRFGSLWRLFGLCDHHFSGGYDALCLGHSCPSRKGANSCPKGLDFGSTRKYHLPDMRFLESNNGNDRKLHQARHVFSMFRKIDPSIPTKDELIF
ncbi:hypothetical protein ACFL2X_07405 [Candidatus Latescibacterota bacterium]